MDNLKKMIRTVPDFPKPGILFYDIATLLRDADAWQVAMGRMARTVRQYQPDLIAGIESRGFLIAAPLALKLGCGFIMIRSITRRLRGILFVRRCCCKGAISATSIFGGLVLINALIWGNVRLQARNGTMTANGKLRNHGGQRAGDSLSCDGS